MNNARASIGAEPSQQIQRVEVPCTHDVCQMSRPELIAHIRQLDEMILHLRHLVCDLLTRNEQLRRKIRSAGLDIAS